MWRFKSWFGRLLYQLKWAFNQRLLILPSHAPCECCTWVFPRSELNSDGLCSGCAAWAEEDRRFREWCDLAWEEYERYLEEEERRVQVEIKVAWAEERRRVREEDERAWREVQNRPGWL